jgi:hypothetical protein
MNRLARGETPISTNEVKLLKVVDLLISLEKSVLGRLASAPRQLSFVNKRVSGGFWQCLAFSRKNRLHMYDSCQMDLERDQTKPLSPPRL